MRNVVRRATVAVALVAGLLPGTPSAHATGLVHFTADIELHGFGIGPSDGQAWVCVAGVAGAPVIDGAVCSPSTGHGGYNAYATFTLYEDPSTCPETGSAVGNVTGVVTTTFFWTRVGQSAVISTHGGNLDGGLGWATFAVTNPIGIPCGTPYEETVRAFAEGWVAAL